MPAHGKALPPIDQQLAVRRSIMGVILMEDMDLIVRLM